VVVPPPHIDTHPKVEVIPTPVNPQITQPPPPPPQRVGHPGLTAKILAGVAVGGAVITGSIAIYTWRTYTGLEDTAHADLMNIRPMMPSAQEAQFFKSPSCSPPASLGTGPMVQTYKSHCSSGETYANATTALWVVTGTLAAAGVVSFIIGDRQARKAHERPPSTATLIKQTLTVAPVFSTSAGGVQAAFEF